MQNRKILFVIALMILSLLIVGIGCNSDNGTDPDPQKSFSVVGTWQLTSVLMKGTPVGDLTLAGTSFLEMSGTGATSSTLKLNEDGTASVTTTYSDRDTEVVGGTWSKEGDKLKIDGAGIDDTVPFNVDETTLTLTLTMAIDFNSDGVTEDTLVDMIYTKM